MARSTKALMKENLTATKILSASRTGLAAQTILIRATGIENGPGLLQSQAHWSVPGGCTVCFEKKARDKDSIGVAFGAAA